MRGFWMRLILICTFVCQYTSQLSAQNWPEFRGPTGDGISTVKSAPTTWAEDKHIKFKVPLTGKAWSSPVVWGEQIWLSNAPVDGKEMRALCFDLNTGKSLHDIQLWTIEKPQFCHDMNSYASSTPALEAGRAYFHFGVHGTACVDTATGKILWQRPPFDPELLCDHHRGPASSPIIHGKLLYLTLMGSICNMLSPLTS